MFDFTNQVAIVTGAGGGIGSEASIQLARSGAKVVVSDLNEDQGITVVNQIKDEGGEAIFVKTDVANEKDIENLMKITIEQYTKIDILMNNAGWEGVVTPIVDYPVEAFDKVMEINVRGVFLGMKYALPYMIEQKSGAIINTASAAGLLGTPNLFAYGASKHAVLGMTKSAGVEAAPYGIRVNAICPGAVKTSMVRSIELGRANGNPEQADVVHKAILKTIPDGRYAEPEEVVNVMLYLASDFSSHITGQEFVIDGGAILT